MIIVDGQPSPLEVVHFQNLEQIIEEVLDGERMRSRIVTDVFVNDEAFSEVYPHQAQDVEAHDINRVEIVSVPAVEMARNIVAELHKVVSLMAAAGQQVADFFRQADDAPMLTLTAVQEHLAARGLAKQKWPEAVHIVTDLPRTPSGKVQKYVLRRQLAEREILT